MASYKSVKDVLRAFIQKKDCDEGRVLALYGAWGVGKTHLCQEIFKEDTITESTTWCMKVTAFFRKVLQRLCKLPEVVKLLWANKKSLCQVKYKKLPSTNSNNDNVYVSLFGLNSIDAVKRVICFGAIDSSVSNIGKMAISNQLGVSNKALSLSGDILTTFAFSRLHKKVIYFDDLERTDLKTKDLLGLMSVLKEQHKCIMIIIFNPKKLDEESDYWEYKEKIIDSHINLIPSPEEASALLFNDSDANDHNIEKFCNQLRITNIRTIKKILYRAEILQKYLKDITKYSNEVTDLSYSHLVFYSHKDDNPEFNKYDENIHKVNSTPVENPKIITKKIELKDFNPENVGFSPVMPLSRQIIFLIENGHLEEEEIKAAINEAITRFDNQSNSEAFHSAWEKEFHGSFNDNEKEVLGAIYDATIDNISNLSSGDMDNVIRLFEEYDSWDDESDNLLKKYGDEVKADYNFLNDVRLGSVWPEIKSKKLLEYLEKIAQKSYKNENKDKTLNNVILKMKTGSWSKEEEHYLSEATQDDYFNLFKKTKGNDLLHVSRILRQFINSGNDTEAHKKIEITMTEALIKIGKESPLNKRRLGKFGIKLPEEVGT